MKDLKVQGNQERARREHREATQEYIDVEAFGREAKRRHFALVISERLNISIISDTAYIQKWSPNSALMIADFV